MSDINIKCSNNNLFNIIKNIYEDTNKSGGWSYISNHFNEHSAKDRTHYLQNNLLDVNEKHLIEFMGSTRKVYIDYIIKEVINSLQKKNIYKNFADGLLLSDIIITAIYGSSNPTSDYDVTLAGPGIPYIVNCLLQQFKINKEWSNISVMFDSNFYICPGLLINNKNSHLIKNLNINLFCIDKKKNYYIPLPTTNDEIKLEIEALKKKMNNNHVLNLSGIDNSYKKLIKKGIMLDNELYRNINSNKLILNSSTNLFKHLLDMCSLSIEAYHAISTIIIIVFGFQGNKISEKEYMNFKFENYIISAVENIIDLVHHHANAYDNKHPKKNFNLAIKVSKYIHRVLNCIEKANKLSNKNVIEIDKNIIISVNKVVEYRNNIEKLDIKDYNYHINFMINKFNLNKKLTFSSLNPLFKKLFSYLDISLEKNITRKVAKKISRTRKK